jgi:hypothetical protein
MKEHNGVKSFPTFDTATGPYRTCHKVVGLRKDSHEAA